jgi:acetylornithine deacetylase/succinyl-diaminopimelate desuccinylase-like protein
MDAGDDAVELARALVALDTDGGAVRRARGRRPALRPRRVRHEGGRLVADEEHGNLGTAAVLEQLAGRLPAACIVGEPTWLDLVVAHRGFSAFEVDQRGRAAHSSQPEHGVNAVTMLGRLLAAVEARDADLAARAPHPYAVHRPGLAALIPAFGRSA